MATIKEDYVSFETAKLLKERGFAGECSRFYMPNGYGIWKYEHYHDFNISDRIECPTLQMAMKWLRETYDVDISIIPLRSHKEYLPRIESDTISYDAIPCRKYEDACETAIKYCLENLI